MDEKELIIQKAKELKIVDEIKLRNLRIKEDFKNLRKNGVSYESAIYQLAQKYYRSFCTIEQIILRK